METLPLPENEASLANSRDLMSTLVERLRVSTDTKESFDAIADTLAYVMHSDMSFVGVIEPGGGLVLIVGSHGVPGDVQNPDRLLITDDLKRLFSQVDRSHGNVYPSFETASKEAQELASRLSIGSSIVCTVALRCEVVGILAIANKTTSPGFAPDAEALMTRFADHVAVGFDDVRNRTKLMLASEEVDRLLSLAPIGLLHIDSKGIVRSLNATMVRLFDRKSAEDVQGTSVFEVPCVNRSGLDGLLIQAMDGHPSERTDIHIVLQPDKAYYLHVKVVPLVSEGGEPEGAIMVAMDTSSKVRLENQLERSYEKLTQTYQELERVTKMKSQFIDVVSHELRTPLTVMRGYVDLVESEYSPKLDLKFSQKLKIIKTNTDKLYGLVESMLDVSRLEKGSLQIHPEPVKLDTVLEDLVKARLKDAEEKGQTLTLTIEGRMPLIMADRRRIRDVFNNLVDNSVKYTQDGGRIHVGARDEGKIIHVWVKDNGVGIPLENLGRIFDRFYIVASNDLAHQVDRIGLSLPISKGIVEAHGGRLWVESQVGKGSVFHIDLPKEPLK